METTGKNWHLKLFGAVMLQEQHDDNAVIDFNDKATALLAYLAENKTFSREQACYILWPEQEEEVARKHLRNTLYALNQKAEGLVNADNQSLSLQVAQTDIKAFQQLEQENTVASLANLISLYSGQFYSNFAASDLLDYESWLSTTRLHYQDRFIAALTKLSKLQISSGELDDAIETTKQWLELIPWQEEAHRQLMQLYQQTNERNLVIKQYQSCSEVLAEELGLAPDPQTQALYHSILSSLKVRTKDQQESLLPIQLTSFVGREEEITEIVEIIQSSRLLTLLGMGGIGKTRLSLKIAEQSLGLFQDGVTFVALADKQNTEVPASIAEALDIVIRQDALKDITETLKHKHLLLILDNFEHVKDQAKFVDQLLKALPNLHILITSRDRLKLSAEQLYPLQGLSLPKIKNEAFENYSAIRLFIQRAKAVQRDFSLTEDNREDVLNICQLTQGTPLALELASSWLRMMPIDELALSLQEDINLLETDNLDIPERQQSLRNVFEYSWQLMTQKEQDTFTKTAIFQGGFTREAAQKVTNASPLTLASLVDKSLLKLERNRYIKHPLIREYAEELLEENQSLKIELTQKHGEYFALFSKNNFQNFYLDDSSGYINALTRELPNILKAWYWQLEQPDCDELHDLFRALQHYYTNVTGNQLEALEHMQYALKRREAIAPNSQNTLRMMRNYAHYLSQSGQTEKAVIQAEKAYQLGLEHSTDRELSYIQFGLVTCYLNAGLYEKARHYSTETRTKETDEHFGAFESHRLYQLAAVHAFTGEFEEAEACYKKVIHLDELHHPVTEQFFSRQALAELYLEFGHTDKSQAVLDEMYTLIKELDGKNFNHTLWTIEANLAVAKGEKEKALEFAKKAYEQVTVQSGLANQAAASSLVAKALHLNQDPKAFDYWEQALNYIRQTESTNNKLHLLTVITREALKNSSFQTEVKDIAALVVQHEKTAFSDRESMKQLAGSEGKLGVGDAIALTLNCLRQKPLTAPTQIVQPEIKEVNWDELLTHLPSQPEKGRKRTQDKEILNGLIFMRQTGKGYNDIPRTSDYAPPSTTRRWLEKWREEGVLEPIEKIISTLN